MTDIRFVGKGPLAISAMNTELPPFKNGEHKSESASTLDRDITPLSSALAVRSCLPLAVKLSTWQLLDFYYYVSEKMYYIKRYTYQLINESRTDSGLALRYIGWHLLAEKQSSQFCSVHMLIHSCFTDAMRIIVRVISLRAEWMIDVFLFRESVMVHRTAPIRMTRYRHYINGITESGLILHRSLALSLLKKLPPRTKG